MLPQLNGYQVNEKLQQDKDFILYRAVRKKDQLPVIIKTPAKVPADLKVSSSLKHIYSLLKGLDIPGITKVYAFDYHKRQPYLVFEDIGGVELKNLITEKQLSVEDVLSIFIKLTLSLGELHRSHMIHKDVTPSNIIVNPSTKEVSLIDFNIATKLSKEMPEIRNPNKMEGTLLYMSPEQTGRMNRAIDYRTDYYSLGASLYEALTGTVPFSSEDMMAVIHSHIAIPPKPPHEILPDFPKPLSEIVVKLLAKDPEERYQSSFGLIHDLKHCLEEWKKKGAISPFTIGTKDFSTQFTIPQKLYGREKEISKLIEAFERSSQGNKEVLFVTGHAGIGKSSLVNEIHKPITGRRGFFISGKYEQYKRNIPYFAIIQAFRKLIQQILTDTTENIQKWKVVLLEALDNKGSVIIEVIPELEHIIGTQPLLPKLQPQQAKNRFTLTFQNMFKCFCTKEHPLVLFLDDLQWVDRGSLELIEDLLEDIQINYLLFIGSFRDNEVTAGHPLSIAIKHIKKEMTIHDIKLTPLKIPDLKNLLSDTLHVSEREVESLAGIIKDKTLGNPFFVENFLKSLADENKIYYDSQTGKWEWNVDEVKKFVVTENVVDLIIRNLKKLPKDSQEIVAYASCIGSVFDIKTLANLSKKGIPKTASLLEEALNTNLLIPLKGDYRLIQDTEEIEDIEPVSYKFAHDRIHQAAYALFPEKTRSETHLHLARQLSEDMKREQQDENLFEIVNHYDMCLDLITKPEERMQVSQLNLKAAIKAKTSAAYGSASKFIQTSQQLLPPKHWEKYHQLSLEIFKEKATCEYLTGHFKEADQTFELVLSNIEDEKEKADLHINRVKLYLNAGDPEKAFDYSFKQLNAMGLKLKRRINKTEMKQTLDKIRKSYSKMNIKDLLKLPEAKDPQKTQLIRLLENTLMPASQIGDIPMLCLLTAKIVELSIQYGNTPYSSRGYAYFGTFVLLTYYEAFKEADLFADLALKLDEKYRINDPYTIAGAGTVFSFTRPVVRSLPYFERGYKLAIETGNYIWIGISAYHIIKNTLISGKPLSEALDTCNAYIDAAKRTKYFDVADGNTGMCCFVKNLMGMTRAYDTYDWNGFSEADFEKHLQDQCSSKAQSWYYVFKIQVRYLFEYYQEALRAAKIFEKLIPKISFHNHIPEYYTYYTLTLCALYPKAKKTTKDKYLKIIDNNIVLIKNWADQSPSNYLNKYLLIVAERARITGNSLEAMKGYQEAIRSSQENRFVQNEALSNELAGKFYLSEGLDIVAAMYINNARRAYQLWEASAKVEQLESKHKTILSQAASRLVREQEKGKVFKTILQEGTEKLDLMSILKVSQEIAEKIKLDELLEKLIMILIENAGAQKGAIILRKDEEWVIEVFTDVPNSITTVLQSTSLNELKDKNPFLSLSSAHYVIRTGNPLVLDHALQDNRFNNDPYIQKNKTKSLLCMPLKSKGELIGILYLENNLSTYAFTQEKLSLLNLISSQITTSIENARLFSNILELSKAYERFVPKQFLEYLEKKRITDIKLGDQSQREMTVLFTDIRDFTTLAEQLTPHEVFDLINRVLHVIGPPISKHHGFIDKYIGDAIMALFPGTADNALQAAIEMLTELNKFNRDRKTPVRIGIGLHTGKLILGTVGFEERMDSTVIADAVNVASRTETMCKTYATNLLITEQLYNKLEDPERYYIRTIGSVSVKGRKKTLKMFEVFDADPQEMRTLKTQTRAVFEKGVSSFEMGFEKQAVKQFEEILNMHPSDKTAKAYLTIIKSKGKVDDRHP